MRYFQVEREELRGSIMAGECYADGEYIDEAHEREIRSLTIGFSVWQYDEDGETIAVDFYPVKTDMGDFTDDSEEVIKQIRADYAPEKGWQNNNW